MILLSFASGAAAFAKDSAQEPNAEGAKTSSPSTSSDVTGSASPGESFHSHQSVTSTIHLDQDVSIGQFKLGLELQHSKSSALTVTLKSPSGTTASVPIKSGPDASGTFTLSEFANQSSKGAWTLTVTSNTRHDSGVLKSWSLDIAGAGPTPTPTPIVLPNIPGRPAGVTEIECILTINKYEGIQRGRNGDHEIAEATLTTLNTVANQRLIDTKNIHLAMNVASDVDSHGLPREIPLTPGDQIEVEGEYIPASRANANNANGPAAVIHFTHSPAGYAIIKGQKYQ